MRGPSRHDAIVKRDAGSIAICLIVAPYFQTSGVWDQWTGKPG